MNGGQAAGDRAVLARQIGDARELLADPGRGYSPETGYARRCGAVEALLKMVCDTAERVLEAGGGHGG